MNNEAELYPFIENYLIKRGIEVIQNEVRFYKQLKIIDLLAKSSDSFIYYLIEVKKGKVSKEDYYNLKYIIEDNNIGKVKKGILIGDCNDNELKLLIEKNYNIELIEISKIINIDNIENTRSINHHKECYNQYKKYFINLFEYISDDYLVEFSIIDDYLIKIKYELNNDKYLIFKGYIDKWKYIKGDVFIEITDYFGEKILKLIKENINLTDLRKILYKIKYNNIFGRNEVNAFFKNINNENIYSLLDTLSKVVDLKKIEFYIKNENILEIKDYDLMILKTSMNRMLLLPNDFGNLILDSKHYSDIDYYTKLEEYCRRTIYTNELNFLEFTNLIVKKELIEPIKTIKEEFNKFVIILELDLKNNKKVKRSYKVEKIKNINNVDFYLFINWDIIIDFQKEVNKVLSKNTDIIYKKDYIKNYRWNKIREKLKGGNTNRDIIKKFIEKEIEENGAFNDLFKRAVWGFDENGAYNRI